MPATEPKNTQKLAKNPLYSVVQRFLRAQADRQMREAKARREAAAAGGDAAAPLPEDVHIARFPAKQIKRTAGARSEEQRAREAQKKFKKKMADLEDPSQAGVFLRFVS
eukprot:8637214-Alexandrium_andersonii.AAC.1